MKRIETKSLIDIVCLKAYGLFGLMKIKHNMIIPRLA